MGVFGYTFPLGTGEVWPWLEMLEGAREALGIRVGLTSAGRGEVDLYPLAFERVFPFGRSDRYGCEYVRARWNGGDGGFFFVAEPLTRDEEEGKVRSVDIRGSSFWNDERETPVLALLCRKEEVGAGRPRVSASASMAKFCASSRDEREMADMRRASVLLSLSRPE